jgi:hypothetical protein
MGGKASKDKGKAGERELADILTKLFEEKFGRVFGSGAFLGGKNAHRRDTANSIQILSSRGDLIPPQTMPKLVIECKWYKSMPWHQFLQNQPVKILEHQTKGKEQPGWLQQCYDSVGEGEVWFLCMKFNNQGWFVLYELDLAAEHGLIADNRIVWYSQTFQKWYAITNLNSFFEKNKDAIRELVK